MGYHLGGVQNQGAGDLKVGAVKVLAISEGAELVRKCRAGDGAAWEEIVQTYSRRIYNLAYRFTSRADAAEDLTQEVFIRVYRSLEQYDPKQGDLQNWLMRLARNLIIDDYRRRQRTPHDSHAEDLADHDLVAVLRRLMRADLSSFSDVYGRLAWDKPAPTGWPR